MAASVAESARNAESAATLRGRSEAPCAPPHAVPNTAKAAIPAARIAPAWESIAPMLMSRATAAITFLLKSTCTSHLQLVPRARLGCDALRAEVAAHDRVSAARRAHLEVPLSESPRTLP